MDTTSSQKQTSANFFAEDKVDNAPVSDEARITEKNIDSKLAPNNDSNFETNADSNLATNVNRLSNVDNENRDIKSGDEKYGRTGKSKEQLYDNDDTEQPCFEDGDAVRTSTSDCEETQQPEDKADIISLEGQRLQEPTLLTQRDETRQLYCDVCGLTESRAVAYCPDCAQKMCVSCLDMHGRFGATVQHKTTACVGV